MKFENRKRLACRLESTTKKHFTTKTTVTERYAHELSLQVGNWKAALTIEPWAFDFTVWHVGRAS